MIGYPSIRSGRLWGHSQPVNCVLLQPNIQDALKEMRNGWICHLQPWHTLTDRSGKIAWLEADTDFPRQAGCTETPAMMKALLLFVPVYATTITVGVAADEDKDDGKYRWFAFPDHTLPSKSKSGQTQRPLTFLNKENVP